MLTRSSFWRSESKTIVPFDPLISHRIWFLRPAANRVASKVPLAPFSNSTVAWKASSTSTVPPGRSVMNVFNSPVTAATSPQR